MKKKENDEEQNFRIVLIEDDDTMCDLISDFLDDEGYDFKVFNSIEDARNEVKRTDIFIVDVMIKKKRSAGVDFVLDLRKNFPEFSRKKVIFISNYESKPLDPKLQKLEDQYIWLSKPFDMLELDQAIEEVKEREKK